MQPHHSTTRLRRLDVSPRPFKKGEKEEKESAYIIDSCNGKKKLRKWHGWYGLDGWTEHTWIEYCVHRMMHCGLMRARVALLALVRRFDAGDPSRLVDLFHDDDDCCCYSLLLLFTYLVCGLFDSFPFLLHQITNDTIYSFYRSRTTAVNSSPSMHLAIARNSLAAGHKARQSMSILTLYTAR